MSWARHADQIRQWLAVADGEDSDEKKLADRLWVLDQLGKKSDAPDSWGQLRELEEEADKHLDAAEQDEDGSNDPEDEDGEPDKKDHEKDKS